MTRIPLALASALSMACLPAAAQAQRNFDGVKITATEIRPGVAVLFGSGGNIGVSYGPDGTILIDDQFAALSDKIEAAVVSLGASPPQYIINTHWHFDHSGGNANFGADGVLIFAHENVRMRLIEGGTTVGNVIPPAPPVALPVVTYDQGVSFHLNGDTIEAMFLGGGHTDGDSVIIWREANVVHMGDLFMNGLGFPFIDTASGGNVEHLLNSLARVIAMTDSETVIIPGHGPLASRSDLAAFHAMIADAVDRVAATRDHGLTLDQTIAAHPLAGVRMSEGFITDDAFVTAIWQSLDAHSL